MRKIPLFLILLLLVFQTLKANQILVPMDDSQTNHLKAYGLTYWVLNQNIKTTWLLNYQGGSFLYDYHKKIEEELIIRGISYLVISEAETNKILSKINSENSNMDAMQLDKVPKIAVYSPKTKQPWDDAVTLVLTYAEIPYDIVFDDEVLTEKLLKYDWLHLHHEDFTGQLGKFYEHYNKQLWYIEQKREAERIANKHGYKNIPALKLAVVKKIKEYCLGGGFLFAMCSATDTYDIALAAENIDIVANMYDGSPADPQAQNKLDFTKTFAFQNFKINLNPYDYEYSDIDNQYTERNLAENNDFFTLFQFSAKWDPIPTMLTQCHTTLIKGFMGQTTAFKKRLVKSDVIIMGENKAVNEVKYIHSTLGKGTWTFYGGHDPEDYQHFIGEEPTDLTLYPNSPGYRLILNNILFPAAKKKKRKT